jgi:DNA-binding transcriptional ArsR family regulator
LGEPREQTTSPEPDLRRAADALFASPTVVDLLGIFAREPTQRFFVNELIRRSGRFPRSVQLALAKLETAGLVRSERQANSRFYALERHHPFYPDVLSLCAKIFDPRGVLRQALTRAGQVTVAFLRPDEPDALDRELVVIAEASLRPPLEAELAAASPHLSRAVRLQLVSADEWRRQARRERSFVRWLLEEPRDYLIGGDSDLPAS